jgi:myo-inositol-1(or 4)-monophosphatase
MAPVTGLLQTEVSVAVAAARAAGAILLDRFGRVEGIRHKGEIDLVTEADETAERTIVETLRDRFPDDAVLAEEGSNVVSTSGRLWIVDPLDGTVNFSHAYPIFGVSIALEIDGVVEVGVVLQPVLDELFVAVRGAGATRNGEGLSVSTTDSLRQSLLCTGFSYDQSRLGAELDLFGRFVKSGQAVRRDGAAAPDLCYLAMGRFDGFWERDLRPWDIAAGALMVTEAGGRVSGYAGQPLDIRGARIVASNGRVHDAMLREIAAAD